MTLVRRLALDIGEVRIGVALSDPGGRVATPLAVLDGKKLTADPTPLQRLVEDYEVGEIVVGLPLSMDGTEGPQALRVRSVIASIDERIQAPFVFSDERLSSREAERSMRAAGADGRAMRGSVDKVAATLILQGYLDREISKAPAGGDDHVQE